MEREREGVGGGRTDREEYAEERGRKDEEYGVERGGGEGNGEVVGRGWRGGGGVKGVVGDGWWRRVGKEGRHSRRRWGGRGVMGGSEEGG